MGTRWIIGTITFVFFLLLKNHTKEGPPGEVASAFNAHTARGPASTHRSNRVFRELWGYVRREPGNWDLGHPPRRAIDFRDGLGCLRMQGTWPWPSSESGARRSENSDPLPPFHFTVSSQHPSVPALQKVTRLLDICGKFFPNSYQELRSIFTRGWMYNARSSLKTSGG